MSEETRLILKLFGISVTRLEEETERLAAGLRAKDPDSMSGRELARLLRGYVEASRELNQRLLEITELINRIHAKGLLALLESAG